jgi:hypothetical protein
MRQKTTKYHSSIKRKPQSRKNTTLKRKMKMGTRKSHLNVNLESKERITLFFINMLNTIKLYHWKTKSYAEHKATDELQEELNQLIDQFVEVMLGKDETRLKHIDSTMKIYDFENSLSFKERIYKYREFLIGLDDIFSEKKDSDLLSIRDDMLACINKFLYLLTLK